MLVFVDFKGKKDNERPDFYVLGVREWKVLAKYLKKKKGADAIDKTNTPYWNPWEGNEKGWRGCSVTQKDVLEHKEKWPIAK